MTQGAHPPPSTPTPRRFLLSKRGPASSVSSSQQQQQQQQDQEATPAPRQFQVAPWGGSNSQRFQTTPRFAPPSSSANTPPGPRSSTPAGLTLLGFGFPGTQRRQRDDPIRDDGSEDGGDLSPLWRARDAPSVARWDSIEVDSTSSISTMSVQDQDEGVTSDMATELKGPTPKRRRVEVSSEDEEEEEEEEEDEEEGDGESMSESMSVEEEPPGDSNEEELSDALPESPLGQACENGIQQPTFRPAPRFKLSESDQTARLEGLPEAFSPQRRGARYVPGGLAAGMQSWLAEVRDWGDDDGWAANTDTDTNAKTAARVVVDEVRDGRRMYLVRGRRVAGYKSADGGGELSMRLLLAGEGKLTGLARRAAVRVGSVLVVSQPTWEVMLEDQGQWTVACDWVVVEDAGT
ncbi:hypothetical protein ACRALDRAFT_1080122 [Sodiomyces alcalophilus JCM 7366]|uniref:uncharacterized protein n=1 Tax=Sodiomyces alcalophilus JCM 7366 TaxID=591952 RepID=UPI0039B45053